MKEAYELARQNIFKSAGDAKKQCDRKVRFSNLQPGDRVLVRNLSERGGPGKLRSHWEQEVHIIVEQKGDLPVYEVTPKGRKGKSRTLVTSCKVICQNLLPSVPMREGEDQSLLTIEKKRFVIMVVTVEMRGSSLVSHPPSWKCGSSPHH